MDAARGLFVAFCLVQAATSAAAQGQPMHGHVVDAPAGATSPYAGLERRAVKALPDEQVADLRAGRGIGLALAAELNGYPGPLHVLELADQLRLTTGQRATTQGLLEAMKAEAVPIGERIVADEAMLDRLFADRMVTRESLEAATRRISAAQGELRAAHLRYHLAMLDVLSPEQVALYGRLRGYAPRAAHDPAGR
jgi:hypothetical protein